MFESNHNQMQSTWKILESLLRYCSATDFDKLQRMHKNSQLDFIRIFCAR